MMNKMLKKVNEKSQIMINNRKVFMRAKKNHKAIKKFNIPRRKLKIRKNHKSGRVYFKFIKRRTSNNTNNCIN